MNAVGDGIFQSLRRVDVLQMKDGSTFDWEMCDPNLLLARTLEECPNLALIYAKAIRRHPCSEQRPWSFVVVFDEFTPGSICHPQRHRKTMNLAFNFLEVGPAALSVGSTWMIPVTVRAYKISESVGGWSACLATYLKAHLLGDLSIQTVGVTFRVGGRMFTVYARLSCLCSDGEGLQYALDLKGPCGIRFCVRCQNILKTNSGLAHRRPNFVEVTCADHTKLVLSTPENLNAEVDAVLQALVEVQGGTMTQTRLDDLQTAYGINANSTGLLADRALRPCFSAIDVMNEDWMHGALQEGTLSVSCMCLLERLKEKLGWQPDRLERFLKADLCFPKTKRQKMRSLLRIFDCHARRHLNKNGMKLKCMASELLGLYPVLRHFVLTVAAPCATQQGVDLSAEIRAFESCCKVIDIIMLLKNGYADQTSRLELLAQLEAAIDESISIHIATYGDEAIRPKHHRMMHIPSQIRLFCFVIDAFIIERLHLVVKDVLSNLHNPAKFEASLLAGVCMKQMDVLRGNILHGLVGSAVPLRGFPCTMVAKQMRFCGMTISVGDVVFRETVVGKVTACASERGHCFFAIVEVWQAVGL